MIDDTFWRKRLSAALTMREKAGISNCEGSNTYRLVHGEGDMLPGLVIDCYGDTAVMQAHSVGMHRDRAAIAEALTEVTMSSPKAA